MKKYLTLSLLAIFALACSVEEAPAPENTASGQSSYVQGELNVLFDGEIVELIESDLAAGSLVTKSDDVNALMQEYGIVSMKRLFPHAGEYEERTRREGLHRWYHIVYEAPVSVTKAVDGFADFPGVVEAEPVMKIRSYAVFDDPKLPDQWHYDNTSNPGYDINVTKVWTHFTTGSDKVVVGVVDGGIDKSHEDLAGNYKNGYNFVRDLSKINPHDHGTHVAGTIAAINNNGKGVSGIAGGDHAAGKGGVRLLSAQIFDGEDGADGAPAIKWCCDNGANIVNNSWGYEFEDPNDAKDATIAGSLKAAIDYFIKYAGCDNEGNQLPGSMMKGGVVFFAAGNDGIMYNPICQYAPVFAVGSIGITGYRAYYSCYGDWVDICAPGGDYQVGSTVLSTLPGDQYGYMQGTSMACPHVTGVAALVLSEKGGPGFTNAALEERLLKGANTTLVSSGAKIGPLVDAYGAMVYGGTTPPEDVAAITPGGASNRMTLSWTVPSHPDEGVAYGFVVLISRDRSVLEEGIDLGNIPSSVTVKTVFTPEGMAAGDLMEMTIDGLEFDTEYFVSVVAFDYNKNYSAMSPVGSFTTESNNPPQIVREDAGEVVCRAHETLNVPFSITDPDGHKVSVSLESDCSAVTLNPGSTDGLWYLRIVGKDAPAGKYSATIKAQDAYGMPSSRTVDFEILENHSPVATGGEVENVVVAEYGKFSIDMDRYVSDPDGETLSFACTMSNPGIINLNPTGHILNGMGLARGITEVTVVASDCRNESCTFSFKVSVKNLDDPVEIYPAKVSDYLHISTMDEMMTSIDIYSSTGAHVFGDSLPVSAFDEAMVDMRGFAPGAYVVKVGYNGAEYRKTVVKQ
ncbi:MAG: S8 family serine peptidase [Candidatus Cryptobacteroides sp.]